MNKLDTTSGLLRILCAINVISYSDILAGKEEATLRPGALNKILFKVDYLNEPPYCLFPISDELGCMSDEFQNHIKYKYFYRFYINYT